VPIFASAARQSLIDAPRTITVSLRPIDEGFMSRLSRPPVWLGFGLVAWLACSAAAASPVIFAESFDGFGNEGAWTFGPNNELIRTTGGNPTYFLYEPLVDTFAPQPGTGPGTTSLFTGNFRAGHVTSIGVDLITYYVDFTASGRNLTLVLLEDGGTPSVNDDWIAYRVGSTNVPLPGQGWLCYDFAVPAQSTSLPAGWQTLALGPNSPPNPDWNQLITDVDRVSFFYGDPELVYIFQQWKLGLDNPRITFSPPNPAPGEVPTIVLHRLTDGQLELLWDSTSCSSLDFAVYEGQLGSWYTHQPVLCSNGASFSAVIDPAPDNTYYLVVAQGVNEEGSYGRAFDFSTQTETERPPSTAACMFSQHLGCP
jgi:hypothetical protein